MKKVFIYFVFFFTAIGLNVKAQEASGPKIIQFSGVVLTADSLAPASFATILIKNTRRGTISDYYGYFSFVAQEGDTIEFSYVGYKTAQFVIPDTLTDNRYSIIQLLQQDTILLKETVVYPWPTREQFKQAFLNLNIPDDDLERAKKNLAADKLYSAAIEMGADASEAHKMTMNYYNTRLYNAGQAQTTNLFNPIAWMKFIEAWKRGDFKKKE